MDDAADSGATARAFSQPTTVPSILGLYAFVGSTLIVAAELAGGTGTFGPRSSSRSPRPSAGTVRL